MDYIPEYSPNDYRLYHFGILGMHWGVRNGPPYPLGQSSKSMSEKRAERDQIKKEKQNKKELQRYVRQNWQKTRNQAIDDFYSKINRIYKKYPEFRGVENNYAPNFDELKWYGSRGKAYRAEVNKLWGECWSKAIKEDYPDVDLTGIKLPYDKVRYDEDEWS